MTPDTPASKRTPNRIGISGVAVMMGWKYQYARDRVLEGVFGEVEGPPYTVLRSNVIAYKRRQSDPPKSAS